METYNAYFADLQLIAPTICSYYELRQVIAAKRSLELQEFFAYQMAAVRQPITQV